MTPPIDPDALNAAIREGETKMRALSESAASHPPAPGEWSAKQLVGHLIDSALNNHQRIIRSQIKVHLDDSGVLNLGTYSQDAWVDRNGYTSRPWPDLVDLWLGINRQMVHALRRFNDEANTVPLSLDGGKPVPMAEALDYVEHLLDHLSSLPQPKGGRLSQLPQRMVAGSLTLRLATPDDLDAITKACQDPEIPRWTPIPENYQRADAEVFLNRCVAQDQSGALPRSYVVEEHGQLVAMMGLVRANEADQQGEVGYWAAPDARGRGVVTRSLNALLGAAFAAGYQRITAEVISGNQASVSVLLRAGFTHEGRHRSLGWHGNGENARRIDVETFSLLPEDPAAVALLTRA